MLNYNLTNREKEIAAYLIKGMSIKKISNKLSISIQTVKFYKQQIKIKLNCKNQYL